MKYSPIIVKKSSRHRDLNYILPTISGAVLLLGVFLTMVFGLISVQNIFVFLGLCLGIFFIMGMFQTNKNLKYLDVVAIEVLPTPAGSEIGVTVTVENKKDTTLFALAGELTLDKQKFKASLDMLPAQKRGHLVFQISAPRRGVYPIQGLKLFSVFPVGLFYTWKVFPHRATCVVYPTPYGHQALSSTILHEAIQGKSFVLQQGDFSGHRPYQVSDSPRLVDWKARARHLPLLTKQFHSGGESFYVLRWQDLNGLSPEERLSQLAYWVLQCQQFQRPFQLILSPKQNYTGEGNVHVYRCLKALAEYSVPHATE